MPGQAWFWTSAWQAGETEASADLAAGRSTVFLSEADFLASFEPKAPPVLTRFQVFWGRVCHTCGGYGREARKCTGCSGRDKSCPQCGGSGLEPVPCSQCGGTGSQ